MLVRYRRWVALALIPIVIHALAWSVGTAALADECDSSLAAAALFQSGEDGHANLPDPDHFGKGCNHGCHAAGHLLGQGGDVIAVATPRAAASTAAASSFPLPMNPPDMPFRPPRASSLA